MGGIASDQPDRRAAGGWGWREAAWEKRQLPEREEKIITPFITALIIAAHELIYIGE